MFLYIVVVNNFRRRDCRIRSVTLDEELDWKNTVDEIPKTYYHRTNM